MKSSTVSKKLQRLLVWSLPIFSMAAIVACVESKKQKKRDTADEAVSERYIIKAKGFAQLGNSDSTLFYFERALETGFDYSGQVFSEEEMQSLFADTESKSRLDALLHEFGSDRTELAEVSELSN